VEIILQRYAWSELPHVDVENSLDQLSFGNSGVYGADTGKEKKSGRTRVKERKSSGARKEDGGRTDFHQAN
jgi:hypothetical protein